MQAQRDVLARMDTSAKPCEDFFTFACGKYVKDYKLNPGQAEVNQKPASTLIWTFDTQGNILAGTICSRTWRCRSKSTKSVENID